MPGLGHRAHISTLTLTCGKVIRVEWGRSKYIRLQVDVFMVLSKLIVVLVLFILVLVFIILLLNSRGSEDKLVLG